MVNFKEIFKVPEGVQHFPGGGGSNFFQGGSNCLFPIETHITCDFPGGVRTPCPPSGPALDISSSQCLGLVCDCGISWSNSLAFVTKPVFFSITDHIVHTVSDQAKVLFSIKYSI